ncbi:recombinase family protein [Micromonospora sp. NPDC047730]|uniref:recombinase family protein n=1 Tax=Micromonospora sp. NPDC047730 TaxID=3364253 RepID=UPI00371A7DC5
MTNSRIRNRWVLYLRLSEQDDASTGIARQEADLRDRAAREGAEVVAILVDDGLSGRRRRAKGDEALAMLVRGEADTLAVWKFDRWSRQGLSALADLLEVLDDRRDARFIADRDGLSSDQPAWRIIAAVLAEVARMESENTSARVRSSIAALRAARRFSGGAVPYGYVPAQRPDGPGRVLVVDRAEAAIIRELAERVLDGESVWRLARELNERKVPTARSERRRRARQGQKGGNLGNWNMTSLRKLLTGDAVLGYYRHGGDLLRNDDGLPMRAFAPILDDAQVARMRDLFAPEADGTPKPQRRRAARLLSGLVYCAECGHKMYVRDDKLSKGGAQYRCPAKGRGLLCPEVRIAAGSLEEHVVANRLRYVGHWPVTREEVQVNSAGEASLAEIEQAIRDTTAALGRDDADVPALLGRLEALKVRRAEVRDAGPSRQVVIVETGQTYAEALADAQQAGDVEQQRALVVNLLERVTVRRATVQSGRFDPSRVDIVEPMGDPAHTQD